MGYSGIKVTFNSKVELTIASSLENLGDFNTYESIELKDNLMISGLKSENGTLSYKPTLNSLNMGIYLKEEETYYILIEQDTNINKDIFFHNDFFNNIISYYDNADFINKSKVFPYRVIGYFKTKNYVGILDMTTDFYNMLIEVESKKVDFENEYKIILNDISNTMIELALRFGSVNYVNLEYSQLQGKTDFIESLHLQHLIETFIESLEQVISMPYVTTNEILEYVDIGTSSDVDFYDLIENPQNYEWKSGGPLQDRFRGFSPLKMNNTYRVNSHDNYPNKFVKHVCMYILALLIEIEESIKKKWNPSAFDNIRLLQVTNWFEKIQYLMSSSFFTEVGEFNDLDTKSQVLEKRLNYQEVYNIYEKLQLSITLNLKNPIDTNENYFSKPISDLYEIWCFLEVEKILHSLLSNNEKRAFTKVNDGFATLSLKQGNQSKIQYKIDNKTVNLYYNKLFSDPSSYSLNYKPDITIEILENSSVEYHHFDAKYKIGAEDSFKEEDIWKMHAYKDAIISSKGATILYPGSEAIQYENNDNYIKAIPLVPNTDSKQILLTFIKQILKV